MMIRIFLFFPILLIGCGSGVQTQGYDIPGTGLRVEMKKTHAHAFLAEYDCEVVLKRNGTEIDRANLGADTGGLSRIDVFRLIDAFAFKSHSKKVCLNLRQADLQDCEIKDSAVPIGFFDFDEKRVWRFITLKS